jgi:hypothetical protein
MFHRCVFPLAVEMCNTYAVMFIGYSPTFISDVIAHSWMRSCMMHTVESDWGLRTAFKTTNVSFNWHRCHVSYNFLCGAGVRIPWFFGFACSVECFCKCEQVLFILVKLFVVSGLLASFIYLKNLNKGPSEVAASVLTRMSRLCWRLQSAEGCVFLLCYVFCNGLFKLLWWKFERSEPT